MKHFFEKRLLVVQKCLEGRTPNSVAREMGINPDEVCVWLESYKLDGEAGLRKHPVKRANYAEKRRIICEYVEKGVSLYRICAKYHLSRRTVQLWTRAYRKGGYEALREINPQGKNLLSMGRPKKQEPQTELERLRYENEYLRAENALLKKVRALMEEREKRLHETGRKPSKH